MAGKNQSTQGARSVIKDALGYVDRGIGTRAHDEHLHWLETNLETLVPQLCPTNQWDPQAVKMLEDKANEKVATFRKRAAEEPDVPEEAKQILADWKGLGEPPPPGQSWEYVLQSPIYIEADTPLGKKREGEILAYLDVEVCMRRSAELHLRSTPSWDTLFFGLDAVTADDLPTWEVHEQPHSLFFLVEPEIEGYAELIQRIRAYEDHIDGSAQFVVVCPDDTYAESFRRQSIYFLKCPPAKANVS